MRLASRLVTRLPAATLLVLLPLAACSVLVDTSGLATDVAASGDASVGPVDAASDSTSRPDAMPSTDGAVPVDAADATIDASDTGAPACTPSATTICNDFDESTGLPAGWNQIVDRGSVTFDTPGLSAPNAFEAKVGAGSGTGDACLTRAYPSTRTNVRCDVDVKLIAVPTSGEIDIIDLITPVAGGSDYHVYAGCFDGVWSAAEFQGGKDGGAPIDRTVNLPVAPPSNAWFHMTFEQAGTNATLTANGSTVMLSGLTLPTGGGATTLNIGLTYASGQVQSADLVFDNLACTVLP